MGAPQHLGALGSCLGCLPIKPALGIEFSQAVEIPKPPSICNYCNKLGHATNQCRGLQKQRQGFHATANSQDGFQVVQGRNINHTGRRPTNYNASDARIHDESRNNNSTNEELEQNGPKQTEASDDQTNNLSAANHSYEGNLQGTKVVEPRGKKHSAPQGAIASQTQDTPTNNPSAVLRDLGKYNDCEISEEPDTETERMVNAEERGVVALVECNETTNLDPRNDKNQGGVVEDQFEVLGKQRGNSPAPFDFSNTLAPNQVCPLRTWELTSTPNETRHMHLSHRRSSTGK